LKSKISFSTGAQAKPNHAFSGEDGPGSLHMDARPHCGKPGVLAAGGRAHAQHVWSTRNGGAKVSKAVLQLGSESKSDAFVPSVF
jgi:hypothetical protein